MSAFPARYPGAAGHASRPGLLDWLDVLAQHTAQLGDGPQAPTAESHRANPMGVGPLAQRRARAAAHERARLLLAQGTVAHERLLLLVPAALDLGVGERDQVARRHR